MGWGRFRGAAMVAVVLAATAVTGAPESVSAAGVATPAAGAAEWPMYGADLRSSIADSGFGSVGRR